MLRPAIPRVEAGGAAADAGSGFLNGVLGGLTGLAGILVTMWRGLRGWPKDVQRTVFQPVPVAIFAMSAFWIGARGAITPDTIKLFLVGLPALFAGTWLGLKLFGRLDEAAFRNVVLALLLASGVLLMGAGRWSSTVALISSCNLSLSHQSFPKFQSIAPNPHSLTLRSFCQTGLPHWL